MISAAKTIETRFGTIELDGLTTITFPYGLVGLPDLTDFVIIKHGPNSPFQWLQSLTDGAFALLVVDPAAFVEGYAPLIDDAAAMLLRLTPETPQLVYTVACIPPGRPEEMTLNLAGPIVVNAEARIAAQLVLSDDAYELRHRVELNRPAA